MNDSSLTIVQEEVFGPVLTMQVFDTEAEAVSLANDSEYGLCASGAPALGTVTAFFLANIPEALSSSAGMRRAGRSARYVFGVWIGIALMISLAAALAGLVLRGTGSAVRGAVEAFAAGAILALVSETMIPEAFHDSPHFNGLLLVVGFVALLILLVFSH